MRKTNRELCSEARARVWKENPDYIFKVDEEERRRIDVEEKILF